MPVEHETARTLTDLLFEDASVGRCLVAPDGKVLRANAEWLRSTGFDEERVVGESVIDLFAETRDLALALHGRARAGHRVEVPRHARTVNGRETWWDGSVEPVSMDGGTGLLLTAREVMPLGVRSAAMFVFDEENGVESRRRAESTLRRDELVVQQSRDIILFMNRDDGRILEANSAAIAAYGYSRDELLALSVLDLRAPETRDLAETQMHEAQSRGVLFESNHRRRDGSTFPVEVSSRGVTIDGTPTLISVVRDITERRRVDESLRESEERLRAAFAASPDAININRLRDGAYVSVNDGFARLSGWSADEVLGRTALELGLWVDLVERARLMERLLAGEPVQDAEIRFRRKDGTMLIASMSARTFRARGERFLLAITRDVSNLKRAEEALREADRRKDEFLGMLSHELRNPLAPIRNSTFVLRHAAPGSEQARRAQSVIERQVEHVTRLVDDLLDVTRIARGKIDLRRSRIDLREVMLHAADDFRLMINNRGVTLRTSIPEAKVWVDADETRIAQLVGNLLHNAAKFTSRGDEVTLSLSVTGGEAEVRVRDTGAGIEPAVLPHVFEAFVQGERTLARTEGGLGLGLALVKGIAELHAGSVRVESAGRGEGAEFIVRLPLVESYAAKIVAAALVQRANGGRRVLVVDDNADAAESLADIIGMLGHAVEVAYDGPSALEKARANPPEIVLCDIGLPGMSGYEVAKALREDRNELQLFAVSGYAQPEDVKNAIEAGFDGHLAKPVKIEDLERLLG